MPLAVPIMFLSVFLFGSERAGNAVWMTIGFGAMVHMLWVNNAKCPRCGGTFFFDMHKIVNLGLLRSTCARCGVPMNAKRRAEFDEKKRSSEVT
jgi:ribosomal protein S27AE